MRGTSKVWWAPPGHLLFLQDNNLMAQAFDASLLQVNGRPFLVTEHVGDGFNRNTSDFSVSANGVLAWRSGFNAKRQIAWLDRSANSCQASISAILMCFRACRHSDKLALIRLETQVVGATGLPNTSELSEMSLTRNIWLFDLHRRLLAPFTFGAAVRPRLVSGRSRLVFGRNEPGRYGLYWKPVGGADEELLLRTPVKPIPLSWSHDNRFILFEEKVTSGPFDLFLLPLVGERKPDSDFAERG